MVRVFVYTGQIKAVSTHAIILSEQVDSLLTTRLISSPGACRVLFIRWLLITGHLGTSRRICDGGLSFILGSLSSTITLSIVHGRLSLQVFYSRQWDLLIFAILSVNSVQSFVKRRLLR